MIVDGIDLSFLSIGECYKLTKTKHVFSIKKSTLLSPFLLKEGSIVLLLNAEKHINEHNEIALVFTLFYNKRKYYLFRYYKNKNGSYVHSFKNYKRTFKIVLSEEIDNLFAKIT